jgi:hypothetical protein
MRGPIGPLDGRTVTSGRSIADNAASSGAKIEMAEGSGTPTIGRLAMDASRTRPRPGNWLARSRLPMFAAIASVLFHAELVHAQGRTSIVPKSSVSLRSVQELVRIPPGSDPCLKGAPSRRYPDARARFQNVSGPFQPDGRVLAFVHVSRRHAAVSLEDLQVRLAQAACEAGNGKEKLRAVLRK